MSGDVEAAGALVTAGLVSTAIEGEQAAGHAHGRCANCGATLAGAYCHACGQPGHVHRSLLHMVEEFFHGILHFDTKAWRTLPLLVFRPGKLTRDYVHGKRARFVSPLALFLFSAFLMFLSFSLLGAGVKVNLPTEASLADAKAELSQAVDEARAGLAQAEADLAAALAKGPAPEEQRERDAAVAELARAEQALAAVGSAEAATQGVTASLGSAMSDAPGAAADPAASYALSDLVKEFASNPSNSIDTGDPARDAAIRQKLQNPEFLLYKIQNTAYKFSWLLVPLSLPLIWLMFAWKRDVALYDHVVFSLYSLSFMSLFFIAVSLLAKLDAAAMLIPLLVLCVPPLHMFAQLKGAYALSVGSALWRTVALLVVTVITSSLFISFVVYKGFG